MKSKLSWLLGLGVALGGCSSQEEIKYEQYLVNGEQHYLKHCSNCHQPDGKGLRDLYPPLVDSDFMKDRNRVICLIKHGISGEITVNGKVYNQAMPGNKQLYDLDIAELTTYIYSRWGDLKTVVPVDTVKKVLKDCRVRE